MRRGSTHRLCSLLALGFLLAAGTFSHSLAAPAPSRSLTGKVLFREKGMVGVVVRLEGEKLAEAVTDESGTFTFPDLPHGVYRVTPALPGQTFSPPFRAVSFFDGSPVRQDFRLVPFDIRGRVTLLGAGKKGCLVTLEGPTATLTTSTDPAGAYSFHNLLGGTYRLIPSLPGQLMLPDNREVALSGADLLGADFSVKTFAIRGKVAHGGGGVPGCPVTLEGPRKATTSTDAQGFFVFDGLLLGTYKVTPAPRNQGALPAFREVVLSQGDATVDDFALRAWTISGRVTLHGQGYGGCTVSLSGDREATTVTDSSGAYSFPGVLRGRYKVSPLVPGQALTPPSRPVALAAADSAGNDFVLTTCAVEGKVTVNGVGLPGCTVTLTGPKSMTTATDSAGNFLFIGVLGGSYRVAPSLPYQHFTPSERWVTVGEGGTRGASFAMRTYDLSGRAHRSGKGIPGITLMLTGSVSLLTGTDGEGNYCFRGLPNGQYDLTARYKGQPILPASARTEVSNGPRAGVDFFAPFFIWHVDRQGRGSTVDGLTWRTAFRHPMDAMRAAQVGDKAWVTGGTYLSPEPGSPVVTFKGGVELYGGFTGVESDPAQRIMGKLTTLDGKGLSPHVVVGADNMRLDGFLVTGGRANGTNGGGMLAEGRRGVYLSNCLFTANHARHTDTGGKGAGFYGNGSSGLIQDCRFTFNEVGQVFGESAGGGVHLEDSDFRVEKCLFNGNQAPAGGGLHAARTELTVIDSTFSNNFSTDGAGVFLAGCSPRLVNCLFTKNIASHNGAIYADQSSTPVIRNCTVVQNSGGWWTGGILNARNSVSEVVNCILWGNSGSQIHHYLVPSPDPGQSPSRVTYSDVQFGYPGKGNLNASPRFLDLFRGDLRLAPGSPCVDAGDRGTSTSWITEDLVGNPRVVDGDRDGAAVADMGAYEYEP